MIIRERGVKLEYAIVFFIIGLIFGSFYNVVGLRIVKGESLSYPPSHCVKCNHKLSPLDLVPVLSWVCLRGKCRYCKVNISKIYPFGELLTAFGYATIIYTQGLTTASIVHIVFYTILVIATVSDLEIMEISDKLIGVGFALVFLLKLIFSDVSWMVFLDVVIPFVLLYLIYILSNDRMGGADVKIYPLIGLAIGFEEAIGSLVYAAWIATAISIPLIIKGKGNLKVKLPFFPFITLGVLMTYIYSVTNFYR